MSKVQYEVKMLGDANGIQMNLYGFGENCRLEIVKIQNDDGRDMSRIILPIETIFNYVKIHAELEDTITEKDRTLKERNKKIKKLEAEIKDLQEFRNDDFREFVARDQKIEELEKQVKSKNSGLDNAWIRIKGLEDEIRELNTKLEEKDEVIEDLEDEVDELEKENSGLKDEVIEDLEDEVDELEKENSGLKDAVIVRDAKIKDLESRVKNLASDLGRIAAENVDLEDKVLSQEITIRNLRDYIKEKNSKIDTLDDLAKVQGEIIAKHRDEIAQLRTTIKAKDNGAKEALNNKDVEIASLKKRLNMLYGVQSPDPYKMILKDAEIAFKDNIIDEKNKEIDSLKAENERLKSGIDKVIIDLNNLNTK